MHIGALELSETRHPTRSGGMATAADQRSTEPDFSTRTHAFCAPATFRISQLVTEAIPELDLVIEDVLCPGATLFLTLVQPGKLLQDAVAGVLMELYDKETVPKRVKFLRVIIKETNGVAATSGDEIRKTIVFNAKYIAQVGRRAKDEILGVIRHEVVHCFQHDAQGTAPGGLIEGVADFVRLRAGFAPPHWKREMAVVVGLWV
ncbi:Plant basic secretory protein [Rhizoctonia solani]|uniref:Plant basic secretory protein n=1 Tax=Rhizoctonia solani TaxID=456999 RepID=A0A8H7M9J9_9AGAM|nr:Plant basic secretory protein [Rhizoctonia solani]